MVMRRLSHPLPLQWQKQPNALPFFIAQIIAAVDHDFPRLMCD
jgi:hypothetical protein